MRDQRAGARALIREVLRRARSVATLLRMPKTPQTVLEIAGREVVITNPGKVYFPRVGHTKLDVARYYAAVAEAALRGISGRPIVLNRYVNGVESEPFFQKRAPEKHPDWIETIELRFPSGRAAREIVVRDAARAPLRREGVTRIDSPSCFL